MERSKTNFTSSRSGSASATILYGTNELYFIAVQQAFSRAVHCQLYNMVEAVSFVIKCIVLQCMQVKVTTGSSRTTGGYSQNAK